MKIGTRQAFVDMIFRQCMNSGMRFRDEIVPDIRVALGREQEALFKEGGQTNHFLQGWVPSDYDLQVMISRTASREDTDGRREFFSVPTKENHRYVSMSLLQKRLENWGNLTEEERNLVKIWVDDLEKVDEGMLARVRTAERRRKAVAEMIGTFHQVLDPTPDVDGQGQAVLL